MVPCTTIFKCLNSFIDFNFHFVKNNSIHNYNTRSRDYFHLLRVSMLYKFYRNAVNLERKSCKARFYKSNVEHMKEENPKVWWKEVKRLCGFNSNSGNVSSHILIEGIENPTDQELANAINEAFLEPLEEYRLPQPLTKLRVDEETPELPEVSDMRIFKFLTALNPSKACGPDEIPNWMLKEHRIYIAFIHRCSKRFTM